MAGCTPQKPAEVTSAWPMASVERIVARPPEPVRWPLTGLPAPDQGAIARRPLSVKIENSPQSRPQTAINSADVVYETVTEGGISRFNCIFQSVIPKIIGPVRSARLSDLWVVPQYHALFFFSGASSTVNAAVNRAQLPNMSEDAGVAYPYYRATNRSAPHNLYLDTKKGYAEAAKRGKPITAEVPRLQFKPGSASATPTITSITIPFSDANTAKWVYNPKSKSYLRANNGKPHIDAATGKQVSARNVVVMWARYTPVSKDKVGSTTYDVTLGGTGRVSVFRDGQRYDGTWLADRTNPPKFKSADGAAIKLAPGNTWFQVIPLNVSIALK
jgi:hypothetical protein